MNYTKGYKLVRLRQNKTLGSLFINRKQVIPINQWLLAENHETKNFKFRPGWHVLLSPIAPHLSKKGRVWVSVDVADYQEIKRPSSQGGTWLLANKIKVNYIIKKELFND